MLPSCGAHGFADLVLDFENFVPGLDQRLFEPVDLLRQFGVGEDAFGDGVLRFADDQNLSAANARRNGNSPERLFTLMQRLWHKQMLSERVFFGKEFLAVPTTGTFRLSLPPPKLCG